MTFSGLLRGCGPVPGSRPADLWTRVFLLLAVASAGTAGALAPHESASASPVTLGASSRRLVIPTAAHLTGLNGTKWRTDLQLNNPSTEPASLDVTLLPRNQENSSPANTVHLMVPAGQSVRYADALQLLFGFSGAAAIRIDTTSNSLLVTSRTFNQRVKGSFGAIIEPATAIEAGNSGRLIGLSHDPSLTAGARTNLGLVNATTAATQVLVELYNAEGTLLGTTTRDLEPFEHVQLDKVFETVSAGPIADGFATVRSDTPGASFFAYASVVDNVTGDGDYAPVIAGAAVLGVSSTWTGTFEASIGDWCPIAPALVVITIQGRTVSGNMATTECGPTNGVIAGTLDSAWTFHGTVSQDGGHGSISGILYPGPELILVTGEDFREDIAFLPGTWRLHLSSGAGEWDY